MWQYLNGSPCLPSVKICSKYILAAKGLHVHASFLSFSGFFSFSVPLYIQDKSEFIPCPPVPHLEAYFLAGSALF